MSSAKEIRTFKDVQDAIIRRAKLEDTQIVRDSLKEKINTTYLKIAYGEPYTWSGKTTPFKMPKKYTTGTISISNGSYTITGVGTSWNEFDHLGCKIKMGSDVVPRVITRVASSTSIVIDSEWVSDALSGASYTIYKDEFGMFPDFQDIRWLQIYGIDQRRRPLPSGPIELNRYRTKSPFREGKPSKYTVWGQSYYKQKTWATFLIDQDYWEDDSSKFRPRNQNLIVYPGVRVTDLIAKIRYTKVVSAMVSDSEEPIIPYINRSVLVWGGLSDHFLEDRDIETKREWERKYREDKAEMEGDIETTDDELIMMYDKRSTSTDHSYADLTEDDY